MDHFTVDSKGFLNLLASQSSHTIDLDSSEIPRFSSQTFDDHSSKQRRPWSPKEDLILISAWLNTSKDPIVGNEQKAGAFWKRIQTYYNDSPQVSDMARREHTQCKQRWGKINDLVCKFVGCYEVALKEQSSGQNENDVMKAAHDIFYNDYQTKFTLEHAWRELRFDQKWCSSLSKDGAKDKRKNDGETDVEEEVADARPPGVKAFKAAKRKKTGNEAAMTQLQNLLEKKEQLSKQKLLERLFANTNTLYELEKSLKNKLISDML